MIYFSFRFLANTRSVAQISVVESSRNRTKLILNTTDKEQKFIEKGKCDVIVDGEKVLTNYLFQTGAIYTINVYEDENGIYVRTHFFL